MPVLKRLWQVNATLWGYVLWLGCVRLRLLRPAVSPGTRLAAALERLGTTFVKLGQGFSLHSELLSDDFIQALSKLQDHVAPFPSVLALSEIERSVGRPLASAFAEVDAAPLAAGSIAQVHRAVLRDGRRVIIKVRRPGIRRQIELDVRILHWFVSTLLFALPRFRRLLSHDLIEELSRNLHREIAFRQETANILRFSALFQGSATIHVPAVVPGFSSDWILMQEMSIGRRLDDPASRADGKRLAQNLVDAYLLQIFSAGIFHGDPHPGNVFVLDDGRLCLHDFGLVGVLDGPTRANLGAFMQALQHQDGAWLLDACLDLGILQGRIDRSLYRRQLEELVQDYARLPLSEWSFGQAFLRIARMGRGGHLHLPHNLLVLLRAVFLMESAVRLLDPEFNLMEGLCAKAGRVLRDAAAPAFGELTARLKSEALTAVQELPATVNRLAHRLRSGGLSVTFHHAGLDEIHGELRRSSQRLAYALISLGLYIASALLLQHGIGPVLGNIPVLPSLGLAVAGWLTYRAVHVVGRAD
jgi:ubiquinone biosynthesis protein